MRWPQAHPRKRLIQDLWPDKQLYATTIMLIGAFVGAAFALVVRVAPVTYAGDVPTAVSGWNWPFGIVLPAVVAILAVVAYRGRSPWIGFVAAGIQFVSFGALGVVALTSIAATVFLVLGRHEGEHANPDTKRLHALHWPDKALVAAILFLVAALSSLVWGIALLTGGVMWPSLNVTLWGWISILGGVVALVGAQFAYRQRSLWVCMIAAIAVGATFSLVIVGPAIAVALGWSLAMARSEGEFDAASPA